MGKISRKPNRWGYVAPGRLHNRRHEIDEVGRSPLDRSLALRRSPIDPDRLAVRDVGRLAVSFDHVKPNTVIASVRSGPGESAGAAGGVERNLPIDTDHEPRDPLWGATRVHRELLTLGSLLTKLASASVSAPSRQAAVRRDPSFEVAPLKNVQIFYTSGCRLFHGCRVNVRSKTAAEEWGTRLALELTVNPSRPKRARVTVQIRFYYPKKRDTVPNVASTGDAW
jgi:hypothetical protein